MQHCNDQIGESLGKLVLKALILDSLIELRVNHVIDACSILTNVLFYFERKLKQSPSGNIFKNSSTNKPNAINCFKIF